MENRRKLKRNVIGEFKGINAFLSNFHVEDVEYEGEVYKSAEHAFQAQKTGLKHQAALIASSQTPGKAKRLGRNVKLRRDWEDVKDDVMLNIVRSKFKENAILQKRLLATGDAMLIEGNNWGDKYWGVCGGKGKNKLGKILMKVRTEILNEQEKNGE